MNRVTRLRNLNIWLVFEWYLKEFKSVQGRSHGDGIWIAKTRDEVAACLRGFYTAGDG